MENDNMSNVELGKTIAQFRIMEKYTITQLAGELSS